MSDFTFVGGPGANGIDPNIKQPYTESWNLGIQRQLGQSRALEVRYVGNRTLRQWMYENINEVNIFQSGPFGVLTNVKAAQQNLAVNNASGNPDFKDHLPIMVFLANRQPRSLMPHLPEKKLALTAASRTTPIALFLPWSVRGKRERLAEYWTTTTELLHTFAIWWGVLLGHARIL